MDNIALQLKMHGEYNTNSSTLLKNKFEIAEDKLFDTLIDNSALFEAKLQDKLLPESLKRAKFKEDLRNASKSLDLDINLGPSFEILLKDGGFYIEEAPNDEMIGQLLNISVYIEQIDFTQPIEEKFYVLFHISESTMQAIFQIAQAKYNEEEFDASLSLFYLLCSLDRDNANYWYRLGIVATQLEQFNRALTAFAYAICLNEDFLGARIFSAKCYLSLKQIDDAKAELVEIKKNSAKISAEPVWRELIANIEYEIKTG